MSAAIRQMVVATSQVHVFLTSLVATIHALWGLMRLAKIGKKQALKGAFRDKK
jgi:hypothetical protein